MSKLKNLSLQDLKYAFGLSPERAIEYFKSKGVEISPDWKETFKIIQKHAFTVSGVMSMDVLNEFKAMIEKALETGLTAAEFRKQLLENFQKRGWLGKEVDGKMTSPWRMNLIYRQNLQSSYMEGRHVRAVLNKSNRPYIQFLSTIDNSTTKNCQSLHLVVMKIDDPKINFFLPPGHFQCRRRTRTLSEELLKRRKLTVTQGKNVLHLKNEKGFEKKPGGWQPDLSDYPKELVNQYKNYIKKRK